MAERNERTNKKLKINGKILLLIVLAVVIIAGLCFACSSVFSGEKVAVVYEKDGALMVQPNRGEEPFVVSTDYTLGATALISDNNALLFIDANGALCYSKIKNAKAAEKTKVLSDNVSMFRVAGDDLIYYVKNGVLFENNLKGEREIATGVMDTIVSDDGRFLFFSTITDLYGIDTKTNGAPVRIAENVSVYDLLHTTIDWKLDSENIYYIKDGRFARINEDMTETLLCENASIGFVLGEKVYALTETQIDEDVFKTSLVYFDGTNAQQIATDILGTEAVSQLYPNKKSMIFTKQSGSDTEKETYYLLDAKGNFRYLCENDNYMNLFTDTEGKKIYIHTQEGDFVEYKLSGKGELKENSKTVIAAGVTSSYAIKDHIGLFAEDNTFSVYHSGKLEAVYSDGEEHYPKLLVEYGKAYICDQAGLAPFYICKKGKLQPIDDNVASYAILTEKCTAYLKNNDSNGETFDLYRTDNGKKPELIDTAITSLH